MAVGQPIRHAAKSLRLKPIALPVEHGGWALVGAPILLGLLVTFSVPGVLIAIGAIALFLCRHPFRLAFGDVRRRKFYVRTQYAAYVAAAYGMLSIAAFICAWLYSSTFLAPMIALILVGSVQFGLDSSGKGRSLLAECFGAIALSCVASAIILAGDGRSTTAWMATIVLSAHAVTAIYYVQARLKLSRNLHANTVVAIMLQIVAFLTIVTATQYLHFNLLLAAVFALLTVRTIWGLSERRATVRPLIIGIQEIVYSFAVVLAAAATLHGKA